jgi:DNA-binding NarL/FixJ family response regulator
MRPSIPVQVLIVSDQPLVAIGLQLELLSVEPRAGVTVVDNWGPLCAGGGLVEEAVVILADLDVQQGERRALVDCLREIGQFRTVLALTALPSPAERERLAGVCAGYLSKASAASELRDALRLALGRGAGQCDAEMPVLFRAAC